MTNQKTASMLRLQRDYLAEAIALIGEVTRLSQELDELEDQSLIETYCDKIDRLLEQVDEKEAIAQEIQTFLLATSAEEITSTRESLTEGVVSTLLPF